MAIAYLPCSFTHFLFIAYLCFAWNITHRDWFGSGEIQLKWEPDKNPKRWPWVPWRAQTRGDDQQSMHFYDQSPIFDSFIEKENIPMIFMDYVEVAGREYTVQEMFPHLSLYKDPFWCILNAEHMRDDGGKANLGWTMDLFMDEYHLTLGNDTQTVKPAGGYWSSPNL